MKFILSTLVLAAGGFLSQLAFAGYLDFSPNWTAPSTESMSERKASNVVSQCRDVQTYSNLAGVTTGAMVVAGPHTTPTDNKMHLTVRLYKNNNHEKSCHVYTGKNLDYASCNCVYKD